MGKHYLESLFAPASIAVFGAGEASAGGRIARNISASGYTGPVFAIDCAAEPSLPTAAHQAIDLAIISTSADSVPGLIRLCGEYQIKTAVVLSPDFRMSQALAQESRCHGLRILGPASLGVMRPSLGLNATFSNNTAQPGPLALISQSGAICTAILDWAEIHGAGFSSVVSVGDASDIDFGDILDYLSMDVQTRGILLYIEKVRNARRFMSGLRAAARMKPVVVVKAGHHAAAPHAAAVFNAAIERAGAVRADSIGQLFAAARLLSTPCRVNGNRLAIITNARGPAIMAADWALQRGIALAELSETTKQVLPKHCHTNPLDIQNDAKPEDYQAAIAASLTDEAIDGLLILLAPQALTQATATAQLVVQTANPRRKAILACWLGAGQVSAARAIFDQYGIPSFANPESAIEAFGFLAAYRHNQQLLRQIPGPLADTASPDINSARSIIENALAEQRSELAGQETLAVLRAFGIVASALSSENRWSIGLFYDPVFGPVISLGAVENPQNPAVTLPPINDHLARVLITQALADKLSDLSVDALVPMLLRVSAMACELPQIQAMEVYPNEARIFIRRPPPGLNPYGLMAIHPYPSHLVSQFRLADGRQLTLRPIRPEDADIEQAFVRRLSPEAKYFRFMETLRELSPDTLARFTQLDYSRDLAFIATLRQDGQEKEIGVARYFTNPDGKSGEFALVVADEWQHTGIGSRLMGCIIKAAKERGFYCLEGEVLADNAKMLRLMAKLGFNKIKHSDEPGMVVVKKIL